MKILEYSNDLVLDFKTLKFGDIVFGSAFERDGERLKRQLKPCKLIFQKHTSLRLEFLTEDGKKIQQNLKHDGSTANHGIDLFTSMEEAIESYNSNVQVEHDSYDFIIRDAEINKVKFFNKFMK